jgi:hypothetical protein
MELYDEEEDGSDWSCFDTPDALSSSTSKSNLLISIPKKNSFQSFREKIVTHFKTSRAIKEQKERKILESRMKSRNRLVTKPMTDAQRSRYNEIHLTKQRIEEEEEKQRRLCILEKYFDTDALNSDKRWNKIYIQLKKTTDAMYWSVIWRIIEELLTLFLVLFGEFRLPILQAIFDINIQFYEWWRRIIAFILTLSLYALVNTLVLYTMVSVSFDLLEPRSPSSSKSCLKSFTVDNVRVFHYGRAHFCRKAR